MHIRNIGSVVIVTEYALLLLLLLRTNWWNCILACFKSV